MTPNDPSLDDPGFSPELKALLRRPLPRRVMGGLMAAAVLLGLVLAIAVLTQR